ncbi:MAG: hypothetical protein KDE28_09190 [Anaerolineales bacterium]|nr:hypothetical protein [Anaerolineales bacterium]
MARNSSSNEQSTPAKQEQELVRKVTERVYEMMMRELRIESERQRFSDKITAQTRRPGGW